jgi:hypothetical protein
MTTTYAQKMKSSHTARCFGLAEASATDNYAEQMAVASLDAFTDSDWAAVTEWAAMSLDSGETCTCSEG